MESVSAKFMAISPRHRRALEMLVEQKQHDRFGGIGVKALHDEDDVLTLEQIVQPLWERGLVEDLTHTEMGESGQYFARITRLGEMCLALGFMLREPRKASAAEVEKLSAALPEPRTTTNPHDPNEEKEAIA